MRINIPDRIDYMIDAQQIGTDQYKIVFQIFDMNEKFRNKEESRCLKYDAKNKIR